MSNSTADLDTRACTSCGACIPACPEQLSPQLLHQSIRSFDWESVNNLALSLCTECGLCEPVCPSHIRLLDDFRYAKAELVWRDRAHAARARFIRRNLRLAVEDTARQHMLAAHSASLAKADDAVSDLIQAALARTKQKLLPQS